eukprot:3198786-Amphidinium_carterae.1
MPTDLSTAPHRSEPVSFYTEIALHTKKKDHQARENQPTCPSPVQCHPTLPQCTSPQRVVKV